jgi:hypothetical protein
LKLYGLQSTKLDVLRWDSTILLRDRKYAAAAKLPVGFG